MPICTMCSAEVPNAFPEHSEPHTIQPVGGLHLGICTGYVMFADHLDQESYDALTSICLCHDCSIRFIDMFPQEFKDKLFTGGHPVEICKEQSNTHPDGCHYSWA